MTVTENKIVTLSSGKVIHLTLEEYDELLDNRSIVRKEQDIERLKTQIYRELTSPEYPVLDPETYFQKLKELAEKYKIKS